MKKMNKNLFPKKISMLICCPLCKGNLNKQTSFLLCKACNEQFIIQNQIPILLTQTLQQDVLKNNKNDDQNSIRMIKAIYKKLIFSHTFKTAESRNRIPNLINQLPDNAVTINIGAGNTNYSERLINIDIELTNNVDLIADSRSLPFRDNSVDLIISQAVLEHTPKTAENVKEIYRVLKTGGLVYCEVPFMQTYHAHPHDYFRFTHAGLKDVFENFTTQEEGIAVGPASAFSLSFRIFLSTLFSFGSKKLFIISSILANWITFPLKYFDLFLEKNRLAYFQASGIYALFKKEK
tara:strand:- start:4754 stop:5632 length:879 start_codon:yes stop_codon:yes gene_type:complete